MYISYFTSIRTQANAMAPQKAPKATKATPKATKATKSTSTPKSTSKATKLLPCALEDILNEFKPPKEVQFDPFKPEARTKAHANIPHSFPSNS